jgi:hypothetical protein
MRCSQHILFSAALLLIGTLVASFLHSELGMWDYDRCDHDQHDFCDLVNNAPTVQKVMKQDAVKDMVHTSGCPRMIAPAAFAHVSSASLDATPRTTNDVLYIDNRTLLI